jgi:hypothetical protein
MVAPLTGFPIFEIPAIVPRTSDLRPEVEYPTSWGFDFDKCEVVTDGLGHPIKVGGFRAFVIWVVVAALTHRYDSVIYGPQFGTELPEALRQPTDDEIKSATRRTISEALMIDNRVRTVENFAFLQVDTIFYVDFDVRSTGNDVEHIRLGFPAP